MCLISMESPFLLGLHWSLHVPASLLYVLHTGPLQTSALDVTSSNSAGKSETNFSLPAHRDFPLSAGLFTRSLQLQYQTQAKSMLSRAFFEPRWVKENSTFVFPYKKSLFLFLTPETMSSFRNSRALQTKMCWE